MRKETIIIKNIRKEEVKELLFPEDMTMAKIFRTLIKLLDLISESWAHTHVTLVTREAEAGGLRVRGRAHQFSETLSENKKDMAQW